MAGSSPPSPSKESLGADVKLASMSPLPDPLNPATKRTRDRPNISYCHSCGCHVDHTSPKTRLRLLDSFWRIVLLCKKCLSHVRTGKMCPYCLKQTDESCDLVECVSCSCRVHKVCVRGFDDIASGVGYLGLNGEFRVCVDCWVPDLLRRSFSASGKGNCEVKGKISELNKTNKLKGKNSSKRASSGGPPVELVPGKKKAYAREGVENNAKFAIQLHTEMKSSSRIMNNNCSGDDINRSGGLRIGKWKGLTYEIRPQLGQKRDEPEMIRSSFDRVESYRSFSSGEGSKKMVLLVYKRDKQRKIWELKDENVHSEESPCKEVPCFIEKMDERSLLPKNSKPEEAENVQGLFCCNGVNRWKSGGILQYRRDKKRKIWRLDNEREGMEGSPSSELRGLVEQDSDSCSSDVSSYYNNLDKRNCSSRAVKFGPELVVYKRRKMQSCPSVNLCQMGIARLKLS